MWVSVWRGGWQQAGWLWFICNISCLRARVYHATHYIFGTKIKWKMELLEWLQDNCQVLPPGPFSMNFKMDLLECLDNAFSERLMRTQYSRCC